MQIRRALPAAASLVAALLVAACARRPVVAPAPERAEAAADAADVEYLRERHLVIPVAGADMTRVRDTFDSGRSGGRTHHALDILAPRGTPVLAADDGRVLRVSHNSLGGKTVYAIDSEGRMVYYYAHLDRYADPLAAGMRLVKGDTIGFVGTTGNAPKNTPHLHFQIMRMPADGKYWAGEPIDPWPILEEEVTKADTSGGRAVFQGSHLP